MSNLPTVALSIRQPWAWLIANGFKTTENRSKPTTFRGPVLIHAGLTLATPEEIQDMIRDIGAKSPLSAQHIPITGLGHHRGGIIGVAEIVGCKLISDDPWHLDGYWGWQIANARPLTFVPCRGMLGFFKVPNDKGLATQPAPQKPEKHK